MQQVAERGYVTFLMWEFEKKKDTNRLKASDVKNFLACWEKWNVRGPINIRWTRPRAR